MAFSLPILVAETLRAFSPRAKDMGLELLCDIEAGVQAILISRLNLLRSIEFT